MGKIRRARGDLMKEQSMNAFSNSINDANNFFGAREGILGITRKVSIFLREFILGKGRGDTRKKVPNEQWATIKGLKMIRYKGEIIKRIKRRTNKRTIEDKINKTKLPCGTKFSRDLISRIDDFVRLTGRTFRWFGFQILLLDLRQVSVRYLTFCTGTYKNSNQGTSYFLYILDMGIPLMGEKTSNWLLDFFIYLNINPSIILAGWRKCGITNALENLVPSGGPFAWTLDMFMRFSCTAAINVLFFSR